MERLRFLRNHVLSVIIINDASGKSVVSIAEDFCIMQINL